MVKKMAYMWTGVSDLMFALLGGGFSLRDPPFPSPMEIAGPEANDGKRLLTY